MGIERAVMRFVFYVSGSMRLISGNNPWATYGIRYAVYIDYLVHR